MALHSPSSTPRRDLGACDSPAADSPLPTSQGGSRNGARVDVARKTKEVEHMLAAIFLYQGGSRNGARVDVARKTKEVEHMLANLEKEGVEIDAKIASIIDDEVAIIKAEAARENINEPIRIGVMVLDTIACIAVGFMMGVKWYEHAFSATVDKIFFGK